MKKSRWTVTFAAGLVVAGIGIGAAAYLASTQVEAQSTGLPATLAYMPATTTVVGHIDFTSLMSSPLREKWEEELERTGLNEFREKTGLDPFNDLYGASFAVVTPKDTSADAPHRCRYRSATGALGGGYPRRVRRRAAAREGA